MNQLSTVSSLDTDKSTLAVLITSYQIYLDTMVHASLCTNIRKEEQMKKLLILALLLILAQPVQAGNYNVERPQFIQEQGVLINPYQVTLITKAKVVGNKPAIEVHFNRYSKYFVYNSTTARDKAYDKFVRFIVAK